MNDLKNKAILALAVVGAILALGVGWQIHRANVGERLYREAVGRADLLAEQYRMLKVETAAATAKSAAIIADLEKTKADLIGHIGDIEKTKASLAEAYEKLKAETAALPDDELSGRINARIGAGESWPIAGPPPARFSFTRPGAEATVNRFLAGEKAESNYAAELKITADLRGVVKATEGQRDEYRGEAGRQTARADKAEAGWEAEKKALGYLERTIPGLKWKARLAGGLIVLLADLGLRMAGVIK